MHNNVSTSQSARWQRLRSAAADAESPINALLRELGAHNPLDRLAILTGFAPALDARIHETVGEALDEHATWPEISEAVGEGSDRTSSQRVRARYHARGDQS